MRGKRRTWLGTGGRLLSAMCVSGLLGVGVADSAQALGTPMLLSFTVTPALTSIAQGQTQQFTATGLFSNLSTQNLTNSVTWSSSKGLLATVSNVLGSEGLATGLAPGLSTITASDPSALLSGTSALTVLPAVLTAITVTPALTSIAQGQTQQFTATGLFSNLSTQNLTNSVTWSSSKGLLATVSNVLGSQGLATGLAPGLSTITASDPSSLISGTSALTVTKNSTTVPAITMSPSTGTKKTPVAISGTGFNPGQTVTITYLSGKKKPKRASSTLCTATVASDGTFSCDGTIPRRGRAGVPGQKTIKGADSSAAQATTTFTLT